MYELAIGILSRPQAMLLFAAQIQEPAQETCHDTVCPASCPRSRSSRRHCFSAPAQAQDYPDKPVRLVVGMAPGGSNDSIARLIGAALQERLAQPFVVENRPGANSTMATAEIARAKPDGYNLMLVISSHVTNTMLYPESSLQARRLQTCHRYRRYAFPAGRQSRSSLPTTWPSSCNTPSLRNRPSISVHRAWARPSISPWN